MQNLCSVCWTERNESAEKCASCGLEKSQEWISEFWTDEKEAVP